MAENGRRRRLLVAIASFGEKNLSFLNRIIRQYRSLDLDVEIVVVSEAPKHLDGVEKVVVGLPSSNPWSLPFAHKKIFAENVERFDLFAYSEDDIEVTQRNIDAFLGVTGELKVDEIAGFLRYELSQTGDRFLPDCHGHYHWDPNSVRQRGPYSIAEFTNEHAAFYLLTQPQLKRAIASGGFLREPYEGRYDMLCTAATDPYVACGFRKVICICPLEDFLVHHMSNRYAGVLGLYLASFQEQVETLRKISNNLHPASALCEVESKASHREWSKSYYEEPSRELFKMVPSDATTILSIGCGWGAVEAELARRGASVTALPLDSVIGAFAEKRNLEMIYGSLNECFDRLNGRKFDCVFITDLIHLQPDPKRIIRELLRFVQGNGTVVIGGPNFQSAPLILKRLLRIRGLERLHDYSVSGIQPFAPRDYLSELRSAGFEVNAVHWYDYVQNPPALRVIAPRLGSVAAKRWIMRVRRSS